MGSKGESKRVVHRNRQPASREMPLDKMPKSLPIQATGDQLLGRYCNVAVITHTDREFVLDFFWRSDNLLILAS